MTRSESEEVTESKGEEVTETEVEKMMESKIEKETAYDEVAESSLFVVQSRKKIIHRVDWANKKVVWINLF